MKITNLSKLATVVLAVALFSCGGGGNSSSEEVVMATKPADVQTPAPEPEPVEESTEAVASAESNALPGKAKMESSDCMSCHLMERKVIGPSFLDIAAEYENTDENVTKLAGKVINGGAGVWGEAAMAPHPSLSEEDAKDMVRYILSL
ncbi:c-type cytochrome [Algoriphagus halophytocola]|uniref:C-type cytochrome n=1 Tax=Algoriphagus halophytocola TaxID=2991499 RepID=A0ABY6MIN4_9BACT|nr:MULTISPECIES: c-type cytochrome [unclassified Algoriphagus]UZD23493.1 c-type cytochrome [Algoriphagus sp. TR-M5]WBL44787.1 c-type cytochrome [Algoriphagus sp. TR-M9]